MFLKSLKEAVGRLFSPKRSLPIEEMDEPKVFEETFFPSFDSFSELLPPAPYSLTSIHSHFEQRVADVCPRSSLPEHVVDYLCKDVITLSVLRIFYESKGWVCQSLEELRPLVAEDITEASDIFKTIRICDPVCSTGQFLQSALNRLVTIQSELGILLDDAGEPVNLDDTKSVRIERTILHHKQLFIQDSLFGADSNPKMIEACRLRMLLEQLVHIEYLLQEGEEIPVLVDCNVVVGDSLLYKVAIDSNDLRNVFKKMGVSIARYKSLKDKLKSVPTLAEKKQLTLLIEELQHTLWKELNGYEKSNEEINKLQKELAHISAPTLFERLPEEELALQERIDELNKQLERCRKKQEDLLVDDEVIQPVEWRVIFPELWDENGVFWGFDVMLGFLPDKPMSKMNDCYNAYKSMRYATLSKEGFQSSLFYELASKLLKQEYYLSFISTNRWMEQVVVSKLSKVFKTPMSPQHIIRFSNRYLGRKNHEVHSIWLIKKTAELKTILSCDIGDDCVRSLKGLTQYIEANAFPYLPVSPDQVEPLLQEEDDLRETLRKRGQQLSDWGLKFFEGIITGADDIFVIDERQRESLIAEGYKYGDIMKPIIYGRDIRPYACSASKDYLLYIPWHFPLHFDVTIHAASEKAEARFNQQYPAVYSQFLTQERRLKSRDEKVGVAYEWYALTQHGENPWDDHYAEQKVFCAKQSHHPLFCLDYAGCALLNDCCFITGKHLKYILAVFNSKLGRYMLHEIEPDASGLRNITTDFLASFSMPVPDARIESEIGSLINRLTSKASGIEREIYEQRLNQLVYEAYSLNQKEVAYIESFYAQAIAEDK